MARLYIAADEALVVLTVEHDRCRCELHLHQQKAQCVAVDPLRAERLICGTFGSGVWLSNNAGRSWRSVDGITHRKVLSVAVSRNERVRDRGVAYAGTEPSRIFRSEDGGESWQECPGLIELPSANEWSFPPRPDTHHVRWIHLDPHTEGQLFAAIEAGALVRSRDSGGHWKDRVAGGPIDTHQVATHLSVPGLLRSAAGDGYFESDDGGESWQKPEEGLRHRYLWSIAVDSGDPDNTLVSAAASPRHSHDKARAESFIYRRAANSVWRRVVDGLPDPTGRRSALLVAHPSEPATFFCVWEDDIFRSVDGGTSWAQLRVEWPQSFRMGEARGLAAAELE